jgi:hypothetical protein
MCVSAVLLWALIAGFLSRRTRLVREEELDFGARLGWKWYDRLILYSAFGLWGLFFSR